MLAGMGIASARRAAGVATAAVVAALLAAPGASAAPDRYDLANRCWTLGATGGDAVALERVFMEPTGLGTYLVMDRERRFLAADGRRAEWVETAGPRAVWTVRGRAGALRLASKPSGRGLRLGGRLSLAKGRGMVLPAARAEGCARFPEASPGARGRPFRGTERDGSVNGFADMHLHITTELRAGGRVVYGRSWSPFGIGAALGGDAAVHGPDGSGDATGNLLRDGIPFGTHDTHGWPTFAGWPTNDTNTHQQTYYVWLQRMWMAGMRLVVAQAVEDKPLCEIEPVRSHTCDEGKVVASAVRRLRGLQGYVDAQSGGPGEGWLRIVTSPRQARRVIARGKLAVVIGAETSTLFNCEEGGDCGRRDVDRGIARMRRLGLRSLFIAHWVNNAFAGSALEGGTKGKFINVFNAYQNGEYFQTGPCPHQGQGEEVVRLSDLERSVLEGFFPATRDLPPMPEYPPGPQCNVKGLTPLGAYLVRRLMANGMLIEVDHLSERARDAVLRITGRRDYPVISGHTGTGGAWVPAELRSLYRGGGVGAATPARAGELAQKLLELGRYARGRAPGVGLGTDTGGFSTLPGPDDDAAANPLAYPFESADGRVTFRRQRTGTRTFDLNADGVAHYGLFADLLADMRAVPGGREATRELFGSAEAYLRTWERATGER